jgi:hypothetical protein
MFNNLKFGFRKKPTDHYYKSYWLSLYNSMSSAPNNLNSNSKPCYYDKLYHHLSFNWLRELLNEYSVENRNSFERKYIQNLFGILKINEMSHDYLERLFWIDNDFKKLLQDILTDSFLNNTLLFIMGLFFILF